MTPPRFIRVAVAASCLLSAAPALAFPPPAWAQSFLPDSNGIVSGFAGGMAVDASGNMVTAAYAVFPPIDRKLWTVKISPAGEKLWERFTDSSGAGGVAVDGEGNIYAAGVSNDGSILIKYNAAGDQQWSRPWGTPGTRVVAGPVVIDSAGDIYLGGSLTNTSNTYASGDIFVIRYDSTGQQKWVRQYDGLAHGADYFGGMTAVPGGGVVVTGSTTESTVKFITIRYNPAGTAEWVKFYDEPDQTESTPRLTATADGGVAVAGMSGTEAAVVKYSLSGSQEWVRRVPFVAPAGVADPIYSRACNGIAAAPDGKLAVLALSTFINNSGQNSKTYHIFAAGFTLDGTSLPVKTLLLTAPTPAPMNWVATAPSISAITPSGFIAGMWSQVVAFDWLPDQLQPYTGQVDVPGFNPMYPHIARVASDAHGDLYFAAFPTSLPSPFQDVSLRVGRYSSLPLPEPPVVTTLAPDQITFSGARLRGSVDDKQLQATCWFEYGPTTTYGSTTTPQDVPASLSVREFTQTVTLPPGATTWHVRFAATTAGGRIKGEDVTFTLPLSPWQQWANGFFGDYSAVGAAFAADPDGDGLPNGLEYALGSSPVLSSDHGAVVPEMYTSPTSGISYLSLVYRPAAGAAGITIQPEASENLTAWRTDTVQIMDLPDGRKRAVAAGFEKSMRLKVTLSP